MGAPARLNRTPLSGRGPMKIFKPITGVTEIVQRGVDQTRAAVDQLLGKGFKGSLKDVFDFSARGLIQKADFELGIGILHLTMDGDREAVDNAVRFREEYAGRLQELEEMSALVKRFTAEDLGEVKKAARDMGAFMARNEGGAGSAAP